MSHSDFAQPSMNCCAAANVAVGSNSDLRRCLIDVRSCPNSRREATASACRFCANNGLMHRSKQHPHSITSSKITRDGDDGERRRDISEGAPHRARDGVNSTKALALNRWRRCNCDQRWASDMRPVSWSQNAHWCATAKFVSVVGVGGMNDCIT